MKITKIEKKKRLYLLEIDKKESLYVTEDTIVKYMLTKEMILDKNQLENIKSFAQFSHGKNLALYFISFKQRTEKEVKDYLFKHEINPHIIPKIIDNLKRDHWIDDYKLLESLAQQNLNSGDKGAYVLKQKWLQKGCNKSIIDDVLSQFDFSEIAIRVAAKLLRKYQGKLPSKALKDKLYTICARQIFRKHGWMTEIPDTLHCAPLTAYTTSIVQALLARSTLC